MLNSNIALLGRLRLCDEPSKSQVKPSAVPDEWSHCFYNGADVLALGRKPLPQTAAFD
jgi:hypothetical protein